ncbi:MAG: insulinase family protein [Gammaproteobacteria bacterium]|nr:MAG: insulinase family protein [Gammaproteobacteria bacterium]
MLAWLAGTGVLHAAPGIQHWQTDKGTGVYFVPAPELPMVDIRILFAAGSAHDNGQPGLANLTNGLLDEGAAGLSANDIADQLEGLGANLSTGALRDSAWVSLRSLSYPTHLEPAVDLMSKVISEADFNQRDFERERERKLVALRLSEQQPSSIADYRFFEAVYGDHPYAARPIGTAESLQEISLEDVRTYYQKYYVAHNAIIAIVGDVDRKGAERLADRLTEKLRAGKAAARTPVVPPLEEAAEQRIHHPSKQTTVRIGAPGMRRGDPDYFPLYVGNHILGGGGLVSRLFIEVRDKRGLSYGVNSYFVPMAQDGPYTFGLQTRNDQVDEALDVMRSILKEFHDKGPTDAELTAAKKNITGGFPLRIDSNSKIAEYIGMIGFYNLPLDYLDTFNDRIMAVSREQITDAFQRRVHPDKMMTIIVGGDAENGSSE